MKRVVVLSFGGSLIVPEKMNLRVLRNFRAVLKKNFSRYKFVVVCGGGTIARKYINVLRGDGKSEEDLSLIGIRTTRMNAKFMSQFFGEGANKEIPRNMKSVKNQLEKNNVVFCGALRYSEHATSDETSAKLANYLKTDFINITNVSGLYSSDPNFSKGARLIPHQTWEQFDSKISKIKYKAGQHFVLDQNSAKIIMENKIRTFIIGSDFRNLENVLEGKKFKGTEISG